MDRRTFLCGLTLCALTIRCVQGQVTGRRIGFLSPFARADIEDFLSLLRPELEKLGWVDSRNIILLEPRTTEGANDRLPAVAAELVAQAPDLILVQSVPASRALMQATKSIPIVMAGVGNPVEYGIVANYRKPGGNVTGSSFLANEYTSKLLQLLKEAAPRLQSVAFLSNSSNETAAAFVSRLRADAMAYGIQLQVVEVSGKSDFEAAFVAIRSANTQSILLPPDALIQANREVIAAFAQTHGLPLAVVGGSRALPASGLIAYGPTRGEYQRLAARYVDQILKGAKPGDLPVEQPTRFHLVVNLKTAKALGLTIPQTLLQRADEVVE
jgi:putative ABC transport system substrate-binding protein